MDPVSSYRSTVSRSSLMLTLSAFAEVLSTIHPITKRNRINAQWTLYRMPLLSDRFTAMAAKLEEKKALFGPDDDADGQGGSEVVNVDEMSKWIDQQIAYLTTTKEQYMP